MDREDKELHKDLVRLLETMKQRTFDDIEKVFWEKYNLDLAYWKLHLTLKLVVKTGDGTVDTITVERESDEPLGVEE